MKTIEVTDEMYDKLIELANEMTTQDPRGTRMPHLFQVRERKKVYDWGLNGDNIVWIDEDLEIDTFDDFWSYLEDYVLGGEQEEAFLDAEKIRLKEMWDSGEIGDFISEKCLGLKECSYSWEYVYHNAFLTAKACKEHIERNHYHYNQGVDYLNHAWRNPEMELISSFLCSLVGKPNDNLIKNGIVLTDEKSGVVAILYSTKNESRKLGLYNTSLLYTTISEIDKDVAGRLVVNINHGIFDEFDKENIEQYKNSKVLLILNEKEVIYNSNNLSESTFTFN